VSAGPARKVVMRLDRERSVRPTPQLVDDLEMLLGGGSVQLCGAGTRRRKRLEQMRQEPLFRDEAEGEGAEAAGADAAADLLVTDNDDLTADE